MAKQNTKTQQSNYYVTLFIIAVVAIVAIFALSLNSNAVSNEQGSAITKASGDQALVGDAVATGVSNSLPVNGQHYNLNVIGAKNIGDVGNSQGHTMFVPLNGRTKILMTQAPDGEFQVTDRNGLDGSASFNIAPGKYNIYARGLGKPGGKTKIDAWGEFTDALDGTQLILLGYVNIERTKGTSNWVNINQLFYVDVTLCLEVNQETGECLKYVTYEDYWVFDIEELLNYYWDYNNNG